MRIAKIIYLFNVLNYLFIQHYILNFFYKYFTNNQLIPRLDLIKKISYKLEKVNIVYIKIFQSLCLEKGILTNEEKNYLIKYTDSVPYNNSDIDYKVLDKLEEEFSIVVENKTPINSGIVGVVFKGIHKKDNNKKIVVKMLKHGIIEKYNKAYADLEMLVNYIEYIPYINSINYIKMIADSKESILNQTDFTKECYNIEYFKKKYENCNEFVLPQVYSYITQKYNNLIVMTDITGLKYSDINDYDESIKYEFAKLFHKFGMLGNLCYNCIQGDFHSGNVFFYLNDNKDTDIVEKPKYQLGIIDFGICHYFIPENQNAYFTFFYNIQVKKEFHKITLVLPVLIENKDYYYSLSHLHKELIFQEITDCIKNFSNKNFDVKFFINLSKIFKSYGLLYTKEFNNICMSIQITNSTGLALSSKSNQIQNEIVNEFVKLHKLFEIE